MPNIEGLPKLAVFTFEQGYKSSLPEASPTNYLGAGSQNVLLTGSGKTEVFKGATARTGQSGGTVFSSLLGTFASLGQTNETAYGSVFNVFSALFFIGAGLLRFAGLSLMISASSTLQILIKRNGSYTDAQSGPFQAGLAQPSAPIIRAISPPAGFTGSLNGVVSIVIWRIRSTTGAESIQSLTSNVVTAANQTLAVPFPLADTNGQDYWGIGVTQIGDGVNGAKFQYKEVSESEVAASTVDGTARTIALEWKDADLVGKPYAPTRDFPPPAALFGSTLEDVAYIDGALADAVSSTGGSNRGAAIAVSEYGKPESYSPDRYIFSNDYPTGLLKGDGIDWRLCENAIYIIRYLGANKPLSLEKSWSIGVPYQNNAVLGEGGRLYIWAKDGTPFRLGLTGLPESDFANDVIEELRSLTDPTKRVMGWDGRGLVAFCYNKTVYPYLTNLNVWGAPCVLPITGNIKACVTDKNKMLIADTLDNLYEWNTGTGTVAKFVSGWAESQASLDTVNTIIGSVRADNMNTINIQVYADGNDVTVESSIDISPIHTGYQRLATIKPNVIDTTSHKLAITIQSTTATGSCGIETFESFGDSNSINN